MDVERKLARKAGNNARGVVGLRCNLNLRHHRKTHCSGFVSMSRIGNSVRELDVVCFTMVRYQRDLMAAPAKRLIRRFESYPDLQT